jgi:hypothetical protein
MIEFKNKKQPAMIHCPIILTGIPNTISGRDGNWSSISSENIALMGTDDISKARPSNQVSSRLPKRLSNRALIDINVPFLEYYEIVGGRVKLGSDKGLRFPVTNV